MSPSPSAFDKMHPRERQERYGSPVVLIAAAECVGVATVFPAALRSDVRVVVTPVDASGRLLGRDRSMSSAKASGAAAAAVADGGDGLEGWEVAADGSPDRRIAFADVFCFSEVCAGHHKRNRTHSTERC
jgi:hypothetical protein